jgi:hypothetical protein
MRVQCGALHSLRAIDDVDVVLIDSITPGQDYGTLDAEPLAWLRAILAASPARPALLFLHHPPFVTGIGYRTSAIPATLPKSCGGIDERGLSPLGMCTAPH